MSEQRYAREIEPGPNLADYLSRIAIALERLADAADRTKPVRFDQVVARERVMNEVKTAEERAIEEDDVEIHSEPTKAEWIKPGFADRLEDALSPPPKGQESDDEAKGLL